MKKRRDHSQSEEVHLSPEVRACPGCQQPRVERYRKQRYIITLHGALTAISHWLACRTRGGPWYGASLRPEQAEGLALRGYSCGLDVVARIGGLRCRAHRTLAQIPQARPVALSLKAVALLSDVFLALVSTHARDAQQRLAQLRTPGALIRAIAGVQPEKGNETLSRLRDLRSRRVLIARHLLSSASPEIAALIEEVRTLGVPMRGVVADKQESLCRAMARTLPGVPHPLGQGHSLRDAALPVCEADRKLKKALRQKVRGGREVERTVAPQQTTAAEGVRDYCLAVRTVMRAEGKYPLEPAGLHLWERLQQWKASLAQALEQRDEPQLRRFLRLVATSDQCALPSVRVGTAFGWVHQIAQWLESTFPRAEAEAHLCDYVARLEAGNDAWRAEIAAHLWQQTHALAPGLCIYRDEARLPRTNNELELCSGALKKGHRHVTGRKNTTAFILREGRAVAIFYSLPAAVDWVTTFAGLHWEHVQEARADLRRPDERRKAWQARRHLSSYLHGLEARWSAAPDSSGGVLRLSLPPY
jgi:hypothetical protein